MSEADAEARQHLADVQRIEQSTDHLDQTMQEAREAVQRALRADSLASEGERFDEDEPAGTEANEAGEQAQPPRLNADELPQGSLVAVLLNQHAWIRKLFAETVSAEGEARQAAFDTLRTLLAIHETGEEIVVRPISKKADDGAVARARNAEEKKAAELLAEIEKLDVDGEEFARKLAVLEQDVSEHAEHEEREEFPYLLATLDEERQLKLGARLVGVEGNAPSHPHPSVAGSTVKQVAVGPFAALLDEARDAFKYPSEDGEDGADD